MILCQLEGHPLEFGKRPAEQHPLPHIVPRDLQGPLRHTDTGRGHQDPGQVEPFHIQIKAPVHPPQDMVLRHLDILVVHGAVGEPSAPYLVEHRIGGTGQMGRDKDHGETLVPRLGIGPDQGDMPSVPQLKGLPDPADKDLLAVDDELVPDLGPGCPDIGHIRAAAWFGRGDA